MNTNQIGNLGEAEVLCKCLQLGYGVFLPYGDGNRIDLILEKDNKLYKVQVKTSATDENGTVIFKMASNKSTRQKITEVHNYTEDEIDFYLLYSIVRDKIYLLPINEAPKSTVTIRYEKTINNPSIKYEEDYLFEKQIQKY